MSEDEAKKVTQIEEEQDEVEAHRKAVASNEEPAAEGESDDDVEGHAHKKF